MNFFVGSLLLTAGLMYVAAARDKVAWISYAIDSFRWCAGMGLIELGLRFWWIYFYGDEPGVSLIAQIALVQTSVGLFGLQLNNLSLNTVHVPKFLRRAID